jgi:hypothetical protein
MVVSVIIGGCRQEIGPEIHQWRNEKWESCAAAENKADDQV